MKRLSLFVLLSLLVVILMVGYPVYADSADAWNNKGIALYGLGKYEEAIDAFDQALIINPENAVAKVEREYLLRMV